MSTFESYYDSNPVGRIDQNRWDVRIAELVMQFRQQPVIFTPLIDWTDESARGTGAQTTIYTEMLEGESTTDEIPFAANYIQDSAGVDSRSRSLTSKRFGDKVQFHKSSNIFQQWSMNGSRDWRPLLRGILGQNFIRKHEILSRNAFLLAPKEYWTFANGKKDFSQLLKTDTFQVDVVDDWNLRLGNTGTPVIPGDQAAAKLAIMPPSVKYDFLKAIGKATTGSAGRAAMWRDANIYNGNGLKFELGALEGIRFQECPNDRYGQNLSVLYNAGEVQLQYGITQAVKMGDGSPDPEDPTQNIDGVWATGQKGVTHYIQLQANADLGSAGTPKINKYDIITIHVNRTSYFGVTNGVDFRNGKSIQRKVVAVDYTNKRLMLDRPVLYNYDVPFVDTPVGLNTSGVYSLNTQGTYYAFVTKARHIGMTLVLGSRGGVMGKIDKAVEFYEPRPIDDFESVWRFVWDEYAGISLWEPNLFEVHFSAISLPTPGGVISY